MRWLLTDPANAGALDDPSSPLPSPMSSKQPTNIRIPPSTLTAYRPLAELLNALLEALNNLRLLAPASLLEPLLLALDNALIGVSREFSQYCKEFETESKKTSARGSRRSEDSFREGDKKVDQLAVLKGASRAFAMILVPFVRRGLVEGVYSVEGDIPENAELKEQQEQWEEWLGVGKSSAAN